MDTIKDFFSTFKDRLTSPFFGSFVISWLVFNWRIVIGIIFYKQAEIKLDGYKSFIDFIDSRQSNLNMWVLPGISALVYTFGYPWVKNAINEYQARLTLDSDSRILKSSRNGYVSIATHQELEDQLTKKVEQLTTFYSNRTKILEQNAVLSEQAERDSLNMQLLTKNLSDLKTMGEQKALREEKYQNDPLPTLTGKYELKLTENNKPLFTFNITLTGDRIHVLPVERLSSQIILETGFYKVSHSIFNPFTQLISFCITSVNQPNELHYMVLNYSNQKELYGFLDERFTVVARQI